MAIRLESADDILAFLAQHSDLVAMLKAVEGLRLVDGWIAAGLIRNAVWDALHGRAFQVRFSDVDVVHFNADDATSEADRALDTALSETMSELKWSVKNQARMHLKNGDAPYANTFDAMTHWPETCTAIAARTCNGALEILAPFGVQDLLELRVRPTPAFKTKLGVYKGRIESKRWRERWPLLSIGYA